jgi:hypothetical protein
MTTPSRRGPGTPRFEQPEGPERTDPAAGRTSAAIHGPPRNRTTTSGGTKSGAQGAFPHRDSCLAAEAAGPAGELEQRGVQRLGVEVRPEELADVELGVRRLPDQEVAQALLAARPG